MSASRKARRLRCRSASNPLPVVWARCIPVTVTGADPSPLQLLRPTVSVTLVGVLAFVGTIVCPG